MGDFGGQTINAEITGPGLRLSPFIHPCVQPTRFRPDALCTEPSSRIPELSASLRRYHL
jgi:hypothetical protein